MKGLTLEKMKHQIFYLMATQPSLKRDLWLSVPASQRVWPNILTIYRIVIKLYYLNITYVDYSNTLILQKIYLIQFHI